MCESTNIKRAMLGEHVGKDVTVILDATQNNVFQGLLRRMRLSVGECWVITAPRGAMPRGHEVVPIPETEIYFVAEDLKHIVVPQETEEEAAERIEAENNGQSMIFTPGGGRLQ